MPKDVSADGRNLDLRVAPWHGSINGADHSRDTALDTRPACRGQNDHRYASGTQVLLIPQVVIGRNENIEPVSFGNIE